MPDNMFTPHGSDAVNAVSAPKGVGTAQNVGKGKSDANPITKTIAGRAVGALKRISGRKTNTNFR